MPLRRTCLGFAAVLVACTSESPLSQRPGGTPLDLRLEVSRDDAAPGDTIVVALAHPGGSALGGLQGEVQYDVARLGFVGQAPEGRSLAGTLTVVNAADTAGGRLRVLVAGAGRLPDRALVLAFVVRAPAYVPGLRFELEAAATPRGEAVGYPVVLTGATLAPDLPAPRAPQVLTVADWERLLGGPLEPAALRRANVGPGEWRQDLRFGDANLSGGINVLDAAYIANVAVGNLQLIVGTGAPARDAVVAGNVRPVNGSGLGEPGDPVPPGLEANGTRLINVLDAVAIAGEAVGNDQAVVGELIPGRSAPTASRVVVTGDITSNTTWTAGTVYEVAGVVRVTNGATLTIQAGTRIEGAGPASWLRVTRDGRLVADGTLLEPIVFTCTTVATGECWRGLSLFGHAPVSLGAAGTSPPARGNGQAGCEQGTFFETYGGCDPADSSGVLRYVRVERSTVGLELWGVGRGTVVDFVQAHDTYVGLLLSGGTADLRHIITSSTGYAGLQWGEGWAGRLQFGVLGAGVLASGGPALAAIVGPTLYNVTVEPGANGLPGLTLGDPTATPAVLRNLLLHQGSRALGLGTGCAEVGAGTLTLRNSLAAGVAAVGDPDGDEPACGSYTSPDVETQWFQDPANQNQVLPDATGLFVGAGDPALPDYRPAPGSTAATMPAALPPADGFFDATATFIGGVAPATASGGNIPWYSGWTLPPSTGATPPPFAGLPAADLPRQCSHDVLGAAWDGTYYYLAEAQFGLSQCISRFTAAGALVETKSFLVDNRGLHYVPATGKLIGRTWNGGFFDINYAAGTATGLPVPGPAGDQTMPAADPDGLTWWRFTNTAVERHLFSDGSLVSSFGAVGGPTTFPGIAVSTDRVFVPNGASVNVFDKTGAFLGGFPLTSSTGCALGASSSGDRLLYGVNCQAVRVVAVPAALGAGTGVITGTVTSPQAGALPNLVVQTSTGQTGVTVAGGAYSIYGVPAGPVNVSVPNTSGCTAPPAQSATVSGTAAAAVSFTVQCPLPAGQAGKVATGNAHTCAISSGQQVLCAGDNTYGQLGDGTLTPKATPVVVNAPGVSFTKVAAGFGFSCALTTTGAIRCWGRNTTGQLGDGTQVPRTTPTLVATPVGMTFTSVAAGGESACGISSTGSLYCWGGNSAGQLGDGTLTARVTPIAVSVGGGAPVAALSLGNAHACAITSTTALFCWGSNITGQLGDGTVISRPTPTAVSAPAGTGVTLVTAGLSHTCALGGAGVAYCWGDNGSRQLGILGGASFALVPTAVSEPAGVAFSRLAAGYFHTCALDAFGATYCWGTGNNGELGADARFAQRSSPTVAERLTGTVLTDLASGSQHTCGVLAGGALRCWGDNGPGQLGDGTSTVVAVPQGVVAPGSLTWQQLSGGGFRACGTSAAGTGYCWGFNGNGELGSGPPDGSTVPTPVPVPGGPALVAVAGANGSHTCGLTAAGTAYCWGINFAGQLGNGTTNSALSPTPVAMPLGLSFTRIAVGSTFSCALASTGGVYCWGQGNEGQVGTGSTSNALTPTLISAPGGVTFTTISSGHAHACALSSAGTAFCWGRGVDGQLGDGATLQRNTPTLVSAPTSLTAISAGGQHTCAITTAGVPYCWGSNQNGRLGDGTTTNRPTPVAVTATGGVVYTRISAGLAHTCGLTTVGAAFCWGVGADGQLGNATRTVSQLTPSAVSAPGGTAFSDVTAAMGGFSCAVATTGAAYCWGFDQYGQLGRGYDANAVRTFALP